MKKAVILTVLILLTCLPLRQVRAVDALPENEITIGSMDAIFMALDNNDLVKAAVHMVVSARADGQAQYAPFLPQLSTTYSYTRLDKAPVSTFDMGEGPVSIPMGRADNYEWAFQLIFPIYAGGAKPPAKKLIGLNEEVARNNLDIARRGISNGVVETYYGLLSARKAIEVQESSLKYITEAHDNAVKFQREGIFHASEVLQVEVAMGKVEIELRAVRDMERSVEMSLAQILGLQPDTAIILVEPDEPLSFNEFNKDGLIKLAEMRNGELREMDLQLKMSEQWLKVTKSGQKPHLNLVGAYTNKGDTPLVSGNGLGDPNTLSMTLQLSWSIYDSKKVANEKKKLEETIEAMKLRRADTNQKLRISVESALNDYLRALDNIVVSKRNLDSAKENFRVLNERYREGLERSLNLLEGETMLSAATLQYNQSIYDSYRFASKLAMITGFENYKQLMEAVSSAGSSIMEDKVK